MKPGNCCSRGVQKVARTLQDLLTIPTPQIVVAQHDYRRALQVWPEYPLAACVEAVAIDKGKHRLRHGGGDYAGYGSRRPRSSARHHPVHSAVRNLGARIAAHTTSGICPSV